MGERCPAQTRFRPSRYAENHTVSCQLDVGHEGLHQWERDSRTVMWGGEARPVEDNTRLRFGAWLEAK